jgi:hypothetical protein
VENGRARWGQAIAEELIGTISHHFAEPQVGIVKLTAGLKRGGTLRLSGHGAAFQQTVTSMQFDHVAVEACAWRIPEFVNISLSVSRSW